jgi:hypothetical protein
MTRSSDCLRLPASIRASEIILFSVIRIIPGPGYIQSFARPAAAAGKTSRPSSSWRPTCRRSTTGAAATRRPWKWLFKPDQNDRRAELKQPLQPLQRIRATKAEPAERKRVVNLCRQAVQMLEPGRAKGQAADLQEHAIRSAQEAARRAESIERQSCDSPGPGNASGDKATSTAGAWKWACEPSVSGDLEENLQVKIRKVVIRTLVEVYCPEALVKV